MDKNIKSVLKQYFGYEQFKKGQEEIIKQILDGQDLLGILPTGAGKSICYQIPALIFSGVTIVISPLISLMKDQVDTLKEIGIQAAYLNSSLSNLEIIEVLNKAKNRKYKLIYVAPERLETEAFIELIQSIDISLVAVDEAHCVSQWGHDFRPSYTRITNMISLLKMRPVVAAFTATATTIVKEDIIHLLKLNHPFVLTTGFDRENLYFEVIKPKNKLEDLIEYLNKQKNESGIIYCSTRKTVESLYDYLLNKDYSVTKYHAGLPEEERTTNQDDFIYDRKQIMIATNAFGMGIDKSNIRYVIHYNMPKNMESYYQEAGRAGRDGENANCLLLFSASDIITNKFLIENNGDGANKDHEYQKLNEMIAYCNTDTCLRNYILNYFGENNISEDCNYCGNCNNEVESTDITLDVQKILSCVKRMNEKFGSNLVVDVLVGANTERIRTMKFNELSTYGIMKDQSKDYIKDIISFLTADGYLTLSGNTYPILTLSNKAYTVLKGNEKVIIKRVIASKENKSKTSKNSSDSKLFELLRSIRRELAEQQKVPPFVIFSDASLIDMCSKYPTTNEDFLLINGVGQNKLTKYGKVFINCIKNYVEENNIEIMKPEITPKLIPSISKNQPTKLITFELYQKGHSIDEIAKIREFSKITIENHLIDCLKDGLPFSIPIEEEVENQIINACNEVGTSMLKSIKELLPEEITYTQIKYVIVKHNL